MTGNIGALRRWRVLNQPDGSVGLLLEQKYATVEYLLDPRQAEELGNALAEVACARPAAHNDHDADDAG